MKSPDDAHFQRWSANPEPETAQPDGQTILDTDEASYDAYMWTSQNCSEGWLAYDGPLAVVQP